MFALWQVSSVYKPFQYHHHHHHLCYSTYVRGRAQKEGTTKLRSGKKGSGRKKLRAPSSLHGVAHRAWQSQHCGRLLESGLPPESYCYTWKQGGRAKSRRVSQSSYTVPSISSPLVDFKLTILIPMPHEGGDSDQHFTALACNSYL